MLINNKNILLKVLKNLEENYKEYKKEGFNTDSILFGWYDILNKFSILEHKSLMQSILEESTQDIMDSLSMLLRLTSIIEDKYLKERVNKIFEDLFNYYTKRSVLDKNGLLIDIIMW